MPSKKSKQAAITKELIEAFEAKRKIVTLFREQLLAAINSSENLLNNVHSIRSRIKDPDHLAKKLDRKLQQASQENKEFDINSDNLLTKINDLAGIRILHLYTKQFEYIDHALRDILNENQYNLIEGPFARTWDDESRTYFESLGVETQESPSMYTSVHYVVESASKTKVTCEIQVRTLMEEVWGEVDHAINYPEANKDLACREQLKVLARVTSSATRLVDSIFTTHESSNIKGKK